MSSSFLLRAPQLLAQTGRRFGESCRSISFYAPRSPSSRTPPRFPSLAATSSASASASASAASPASVLGKTLFRGNATYLTFIFGGAVVLEMAYGSVLDGLWNARNHGRTFASTDWSKWKAADEEAE